jgi:hypothetical protein
VSNGTSLEELAFVTFKLKFIIQSYELFLLYSVAGVLDCSLQIEFMLSLQRGSIKFERIGLVVRGIST